ncbi:hypothetical protein ACQ4LE_001005 [Meloidogyne hapla]|uniref:Chitin-binding type-1 domain-containing protein n=1 Tax=Meloidogyne hapla TaxID=6305 RepID=A0A1I8BRW1_MELHA
MKYRIFFAVCLFAAMIIKYNYALKCYRNKHGPQTEQCFGNNAMCKVVSYEGFVQGRCCTTDPKYNCGYYSKICYENSRTELSDHINSNKLELRPDDPDKPYLPPFEPPFKPPTDCAFVSTCQKDLCNKD